MPIAIEIKNVSFSYITDAAGLIKALSDIDLKIEDGEFVGIMGRSGCGKTTLIQLIAGLLVPDKGEILVDGKDINLKSYNRSELRRKLGLVFQYPECQLFETTVEKDVAFGLKHSGLAKSEINDRIKWAIEKMGFEFEKVRLQSPLALSGGEKRRIAIAGVLAVKPDILIFDEPVAGLDPLGREAFLKLVSELNREGTTVIIVSHNADMHGEYSRRLVILENGHIAADGETKAVFSDADTMKKLKLGVSTPRLIADMLMQRGFKLPADTIGYNQLLEALKSKLKGGD
ncbi:MAG: ATP-binding cassette domain-containing protein [Oscillospiraceae bacterium]|nr:ATP-binding cassette domain-containing protein [Oscillospiraceae bacterium]